MSGIFDLGKLLAVTYGIDDAQLVSRAFIKSIYDGVYYSEQTACFDSVLYAASCLDLLYVQNAQIRLSKTGREFVQLMSVRGNDILLDGNNEQRQFLFDCLGARRIADACGAIFKKFLVNHADEPPVWNSRAHVFDHNELYILEILEDVGVVYSQRGLITVDDSHTDIFSRMKNSISVDLDVGHERKKQVGDIGEVLTMEYEIKRLSKCEDLPHRVEQVSKTDPYAGYDIASFHGCQSGRYHDMFIEVKATSGVQPRFFWSSNEVDVARKHGDTYWIYLWTDIDGSKTLHRIQNPYARLFETGEPRPEPASYLVDKQILGQKNIIHCDG